MTHRVTKFPELCPPLKVETEFECILSNGGVHCLNSVVVLEQFQHVPIRLPEELDPRSEENAISALLGPLPTHSAQEEAAGRGGGGEG